ncbi:MAG: glycoside hydrolase family 3 N-terminal domain-containing protein [Cyanobacteriota bacterium]
MASLLVVRASGHLSDDQRRYPQWETTNAELKRLLEAGIGGVILLGAGAPELRLRTDQLRRWAHGPVLLCADVEEGVGQRFEGLSWLLPPLALGRLHGKDPAQAVALAEAYGGCTGREARRVGLNGVLAPVCDVNNNPANPVINVRAWGEDPATVSALVAAFSRGLQRQGVLGCAKHFPGHGDTDVDSHLALPRLNHGRERLEAVEFPPFRAALAADIAAVMSAHLLLEPLDPQRPATLSRAVLHDLLRRDLGFEGLVITDALVMEAISARHGAGEAVVLALEAGADLALMPADPWEAITAVEAALEGGRLQEAALRRSAARRLEALERFAAPPIDHPQLEAGPIAEDRHLAETLVRRTLVGHGEGRGVPAGSGAGTPGLNLIRIDRSLACPFLSTNAPALVMPQHHGFRPCLLAGDGVSPCRAQPEAPLDLERLGNGPVLLQLFVRGNPFRGEAGSGEPWPAAVRQLLDAGRLAGLAVFGSPDLWDSLEPLLPPDLPAAYSPGQMPLAQQHLLAALGLGTLSAAGDFTD